GDPILDPEGNPDTSFLVQVPADTPFTFQTLDRNGLVLNMAQTWHQVRPGEMRADCGGCHAHGQLPLAFATTAAALPDYPIADLSKDTPLLTRNADGTPGLSVAHVPAVAVEFLRDVRPLLQRSCVPCHQGGAAAPGKLDLGDLAPVGGLPGDYRRLAADSDATWGHPPVIPNGTWRQTNASRYVRAFQSRRSLLVWKLFGERLDGWTNADHPTESVPGDPGTLPAGADPNAADLDYTGDIMPPPGAPVPPLTSEERLTIVRWIDLGCPIDTGAGADAPYGWLLDDQRPALALSLPRPGANETPVDRIRIGVADGDSGVDLATLSLRADFEVSGRPAGSELADLASAVADGVYEVAFGSPLPPRLGLHVDAEVRDVQGNVTRVRRAFATFLPLFADDFERGHTLRWSATSSSP
ncbi:MAG: hypothetical protein KDB94_11910, partial [Acidobacteria bacterium]|nr:hypothetical protein [Acidobacteriota bacterium]